MRKAPLDTDIYSECLKGKDRQVGSRYAEYLAQHHRLTITSCTVYEFLTGIHKNLPTKLAEAVAAMAKADEITPTPQDYRLAAEIKGRLLSRGRPVGDMDPLIAACAIERSMPLVMGNTSHYQFVVDAGFPLELENWRNA